MIVGDEKYLKHFHKMVMLSFYSGLDHPVEWIEDYSRASGEPYDTIPEIDEFCNLAIIELYAAYHCVESTKVTMAMCNEWINKHYKQ